MKKIYPLDIEYLNHQWEIKGSKYIILEEILATRSASGGIKRMVRVECRDCGDIQERSYRQVNKNGEKCWNCHLISENKTDHPLYRRLMVIIQRCENTKDKDYPNYGARRISVCKEWRENPQSFIDWSENNGYKPHLTIDREDNDKGYSPENCRWITRADNNRNQSSTKLDWNKVKYIRTSDKSIDELAKELEVHNSTVDNVRKFKTWVK